ncbi:2,3-butanediol dehydrogenase [Lentibacillus saliphilus]|uniref:2,3-butanediol dehydrogenase n=1 Tax=Lentibacillus saliphilus TaxID=2737028 RepID=UPI001C2F1FE8|nr:2,3-butanediol dehydrogenase [Lentibacillus saliphilus]
MKAVRWHGQRDLRVEDIQEPSAEPGKVKIKVAWTGICGSDLHEYAAGPIFIPEGQQHPLTKDQAPIVMGHEFAGEVVEVGEGVDRIKLGDRVTVEPIYRCGECAACRSGKYNLCDSLGFHGLSGGGGGFSQFTTVPENMVHTMPDTMSYEQGALVEPAAVALHSIRMSRFKAGDTAAVFGAGPIGLLTIQALFLSGASQVYAVEISEERKQFAEEIGAIVIDPTEVDAVAEIQKLTDGGVDVSYEVTGVAQPLQQCIDCIKPGGEAMVVSIWESNPEINANNIVLKEKYVTGAIAYRDIFPAVINLIASGKFEAEKLITKRIELDQIVDEGFESLMNERSQVKILVRSNPDME